VTGALGVGEIIETALAAISLKRASVRATYETAVGQT
jgi:hypothetical protein